MGGSFKDRKKKKVWELLRCQSLKAKTSFSLKPMSFRWDCNSETMWLLMESLEKGMFWFAVELVWARHTHDKPLLSYSRLSLPSEWIIWSLNVLSCDRL